MVKIEKGIAMEKNSLPSILRGMEPGDSFLTDKSRAAVYVAAKRAEVTVVTSKTAEGLRVWRTGATESVADPAEVPMSKEEKLENLRELMANPGILKQQQEPIEENWQFTKDPPQYAYDGNVYRNQLLGPEWKRRRTVQVDEMDHEEIIRVVIR